MRGVTSVVVGTVLGLLLVPREILAQGSSSASITGTVRDTSGAVLPGVTVEASSPALIEKVRSTVTDDRGDFRIVELRTGAYTVSFTLPGFSTFRRDGLELPPNFTATLNVELRVGALEETVTVSGQTPLVDVTSVSEQRSLGRAELDSLPTAKNILGFAALMPSVVMPPNAQDVGGTKGETSVRMSIHGGKAEDGRLLQDGMRFNGLLVNGTGRGFYLNPLSAQETVVDAAGGGSAEYATAGSQLNVIPKDGGNRFAGSLFTAYMNNSMQGDNFTDELKAQGLASVNNTREIYDVNGIFGGPVVTDKLWFISAHRTWGLTARIANLHHDANASLTDIRDPNYWIYKADLSKPVDAPDTNRAHNIRFTWQAAAKHKITGSYEWQRDIVAQNTGQLNNGTQSIESSGGYCPQPRLTQFTWTNPASSRLLFEAGSTFLVHYRSEILTDTDVLHCGPSGADKVQIVSPGFTYHGSGSRAMAKSNPTNERFSMSYVTGSHNFKVGLFYYADMIHTSRTVRAPTDIALPLSYSFTNNVPTSLTQFVDDVSNPTHMRPELGLFAQDQWRLNRLTLSLGLRFDYLRVWSPEIQRPAGVLNDSFTFPRVDCLPCWKDLNPRLAASFDLSGDGRTALKASMGRYVLGQTTTIAELLKPSAAAVNSTTRAWNDSFFPAGDPRRGNFLPDCNLRNPALNAECGAMANSNFGQVTPSIAGDPGWLNGWGTRPSVWKTSLSIDREVLPGVAVSAGFYRTWFGNFMATDNLNVTPADYSPYCVTAPTDSRLPGNISGQQICGLFDINPDKFGSVNNLVTLASNYGDRSEVYNGGEVTFAARLPGGGTLTGGWNVGNSISSTATAGGSTVSKSNDCFVIDSPQQLYNCETGNPYQNRFKFSGSYGLPWDLRASAVFQRLPGPDYSANVTYPVAAIQPSLGRALSGNVRNVTINILQPLANFIDNRINQLDLRFSKIVRLGQRRLQANFDIYNVTNGSTVLTVNNTYTAGATNPWLRPTQILDARMLKVGFQVDF